MEATLSRPSQVALSPQRRRVVLVTMCLSLFIVVLDNTIVNVALPTLVTELDASTSDLQWVVDAFALTFAGLLFAGGSLGDRFGRRPILVAGLAIVGLFSFLGSLADDVHQLIAARAVMGVGAALAFPATLAIITNVFTDARERARAIAAWTAVAGLAVACGPIIGGFLLEHFSWGSVLLVNAPICIVAVTATWVWVPRGLPRNDAPLDVLGVLLSIAAIGALVYAIIEGPVHGWTDVRTLGLLGIGAVMVVGFVRRELRTAHPMLDVSVFRDRAVSAPSLAIFAAFFALFGMIFLLTQLLQLARGDSALEAGLRTLPLAVGAAIGANGSARVTVRLGEARVLVSGLTTMASGLLLVAIAAAADWPYWPIAIGLASVGVGMGATTAPSTGMIMRPFDDTDAGVGSAINDSAREVGGVLGVAVLGSLASTLYSGALDVTSLPDAPAEAARSGIGGALAAAASLPADVGRSLTTAAIDAFSTAMSVTLAIAGASTLAVAGITWRLLRTNERLSGHHTDDASSHEQVRSA